MIYSLFSFYNSPGKQNDQFFQLYQDKKDSCKNEQAILQ